MLLRFTVNNFASFRDETELTIIAEKHHEDLAVRRVPRSPQWALPAAGIFGPNASGKSNFIHALAFMRGAVLNSHQRWRPRAEILRRPFLLDPEKANQPSEFTIEFVAEGIRYDYGFTCDSKEFLSEWLFSYPEGAHVGSTNERPGLPSSLAPPCTAKRFRLSKCFDLTACFCQLRQPTTTNSFFPYSTGSLKSCASHGSITSNLALEKHATTWRSTSQRQFSHFSSTQIWVSPTFPSQTSNYPQSEQRRWRS